MPALQKLFALCMAGLGCLSIAPMAIGAELDHSHTLFTHLLSQYVHNARVDYAGLQAHPQELKHYLNQIAAVPKSEFAKWSEGQQIAFLLNAYNAYTLELIVDHYPVKSIKDIGGLTSGPWDQPVVKLFSETTTLNALEHKVLRKNYSEPRIHFALVCAAKGCPPLRTEAYVSDRLNDQLDDQARQFLATTTKNRLELGQHIIYLSPIFKWYAQDFEKNSGSVLAALKPYWPKDSASALTGSNFKIRYTDYDWSLNEQAQK